VKLPTDVELDPKSLNPDIKGEKKMQNIRQKGEPLTRQTRLKHKSRGYVK